MALILRGAALVLRAGMSVLVQYQGFLLYHERLLVAELDDMPGLWAVLTPDDDLYVEEIAVPALDDIQILGPRRGLPRGIAAANVYLFDPPPAPDQIAISAPRAQALLAAERIRLVRQGLLAPAAPPPPPAALLFPTADT